MSKKHKKNNYLMYYAKILIAISLAILAYGLVLDLSNNIHLIDPRSGVSVVNDDNGSFTSVDNNNNTNIVNGNNGGNNSNTNTGGTVSGGTSSNNRGQTGTNTNSVDANTLNALRNSIQQKYNVAIKYGGETEGYVVGGLSTVALYDNNAIYNSLVELNNILSLYPYGLFTEIRNGGIPLTIYLISNYSDDTVTGATDSTYSYANISIAVIYPLDESFFHESYHYIERFILKRGLGYNSTTWNSFNPFNYNYGTIVNEYSYKNTFSPDSFFVNNYAQVSAEEDRASTFEYMMASSKASCLNNNKPVWKKAVLMSNTIDAALDTVSPNNMEYWERFL